MSPRRAWALAGALAVVALALRLPAAAPGGPLAPEEVLRVARAVRFAERGAFGPGPWDGPWLGPLLAWPALAALGPTRLALALPGALAGAGAVLLLAGLGRRLGAVPALLGAALWALDPVAIGAARGGRPEALAAAFLVAGLAAALRWREGGRAGWLAAAGGLLGLACAASGAALLPLAALALALAAPALWRGWHGEAGGEAGLVLSGLVAVPAAVALLTLLPWFLAGHGIGDLPDLAEAVLLAAGAPAEAGASAPAAWFLVPSPAPGGPNPVTWLLALPGLAWATSAGTGAGSRSPVAVGVALIPLLAAASYLPLLAGGRALPIAAAVPALPFVFLAVAGAVCAFAARRGLRWLPPAYLALAAAWPFAQAGLR